MDQVRSCGNFAVPYTGHASSQIDRPGSHLTPSGSGSAPTPYRSKTPAIGSAHSKGLTLQGPLQKFPLAICQSRSPARDDRRQDPAIPASDLPISQPSAGRPPPGSCSSRNFRKRHAMAGGLPWRVWHGELREHGSWRPEILSARREFRKSTSGAAACSVTEQWRGGRSSRRASMMPILSSWGSAYIRHNIAQERQG